MEQIIMTRHRSVLFVHALPCFRPYPHRISTVGVCGLGLGAYEEHSNASCLGILYAVQGCKG